jgi:protein phosphatase
MSEHSAAETSAVSTERLVVQAVLRTDVGLVRSENQDFGIYTTPSEEREAHPGGRLLVVADGMGGHRGGATASRLAAETVKAQYLGSEGTDIPGALLESLTRANARIFHEAQANPDLRGMGTTTSALVVRDGNAWFGHVGDSRIYMVRGSEIKQLTEDHSLVATMVREGLLTKTEAENHPRRNVLQRSMGVSEQVEIDVSGPFPLVEGDIFILCSDGLHGVVKEEEMLAVAQKPLREAADEFIKKAIERGAPDNVTVIVARVVRAGELGEDTVIDGVALDDTQKDTAKIVAFDDTLEMPPPPPVASPAIPPVEPPAPPPVAEVAEPEAVHDVGVDDQAITQPGTEPTPQPRDPATPRSGIAKWLVLLVVLLGAAGAWLFWNQHQQQGTSRPPSTSPR